MRFGSVCSGIEAASVAWGPLGWEAAWFSEIEAFPSEVLKHHYPQVPNLGDMTRIAAWIRAGLIEAPDILCGGTPCQAFSVAGQRKSLEDARGNLTLTFCEIANAIDDRRDTPAIIFWENVPGVLSTADNAFGCFLAELAGEDEPLVAAGGKWANAGAVFGPRRTVAWRTMDAQFFGLAQRRRRVFVVASAREDFDPVEVLLEWDGVRRDSAPSRSSGEAPAAGTARSVALRGRDGGATAELGDEVAGCLRASSGGGDKPHALTTVGTLRSTDGGCDVDHALAGHLTTVGPLMAAHGPAGHGGSGIATQQGAESGHVIPVLAFKPGPIDAAAALNANRGCHNPGDFEAGTLLVQPLPFDTTQITSPANFSNPQVGDPSHPLAAQSHAPCIAVTGDITHALNTANNGKGCSEDGTGRGVPTISAGMQVRRLMPEECELLQGFPVGYTAITFRGKPAADGPRYKALGNSWAVTNVRWIGRRIARALGVAA